MKKKTALTLALVMLAIVVWWLMVEGSPTSIIINGHELKGPLKGAIGVVELIVIAITLYCAAIFLALVFAGVGLFVLGCLVVLGLILAGFAFPFLLLWLVPLAIVWAFIVYVVHGS